MKFPPPPVATLAPVMEGSETSQLFLRAFWLPIPSQPSVFNGSKASLVEPNRQLISPHSPFRVAARWVFFPSFFTRAGFSDPQLLRNLARLPSGGGFCRLLDVQCALHVFRTFGGDFACSLRSISTLNYMSSPPPVATRILLCVRPFPLFFAEASHLSGPTPPFSVRCGHLLHISPRSQV